jgi:hypothetical protein
MAAKSANDEQLLIAQLGLTDLSLLVRILSGGNLQRRNVRLLHRLHA